MRSNLAQQLVGGQRKELPRTFWMKAVGGISISAGKWAEHSSSLLTMLDLGGALPGRRPIQEVLRDVAIPLVVIRIGT